MAYGYPVGQLKEWGNGIASDFSERWRQTLRTIISYIPGPAYLSSLSSTSSISCRFFFFYSWPNYKTPLSIASFMLKLLLLSSPASFLFQHDRLSFLRHPACHGRRPLDHHRHIPPCWLDGQGRSNERHSFVGPKTPQLCIWKLGWSCHPHFGRCHRSNGSHNRFSFSPACNAARLTMGTWRLGDHTSCSELYLRTVMPGLQY